MIRREARTLILAIAAVTLALAPLWALVAMAFIRDGRA